MSIQEYFSSEQCFCSAKIRNKKFRESRFHDAGHLFNPTPRACLNHCSTNLRCLSDNSDQFQQTMRLAVPSARKDYPVAREARRIAIDYLGRVSPGLTISGRITRLRRVPSFQSSIITASRRCAQARRPKLPRASDIPVSAKTKRSCNFEISESSTAAYEVELLAFAYPLAPKTSLLISPL